MTGKEINFNSDDPIIDFGKTVVILTNADNRVKIHNKVYEQRLDVVITYLNQKYIVELKIWRGKEAHNEGLDQLSDYLDRQNLKTGYLLIYDFRVQEKEYRQQKIDSVSN